MTARAKKGFPNSSGSSPERSGLFNHFLDVIERMGNLLPHPITLFVILCLFVAGLSALLGTFGVSVADPRPTSQPGDVVTIQSLVSAEGLRWLISNIITNFTNFAPLGTVLTVIIGIGIAEKSGLISCAMQRVILGASPRMVTVMIILVSILSNVASDLGYVVVVPLAAYIFYTLGRHPLAGIAAAFAGVSGGYSANLIIGTLDPLLGGITTAAAQTIDPNYVVGPEANWYFMAFSVFLITTLGVFVTENFVEPKLGKYNPEKASIDLSELKQISITPLQLKGLRYAGLMLLFMLSLIALTIIPEWGILRNQETGGVKGSPFLKGIVVFCLVCFALPGLVYGYVTGAFKKDRDVIDAMSQTMSTMGMYIVLVFFAAQFIQMFKWTNMAPYLAICGSEFLKESGLSGPVLMMTFMIMSSTVNLLIGSSSAQWAATAPIFVPMLMLTGYSPETIQTAYRIGDSVTNIIAPTMSYYGLILAMACRYQKDLGIGTLIATMLPYSIVFFIGWSITFLVWVFGLGLPVGPGSPTFYG